jgi:hypothetical protein
MVSKSSDTMSGNDSHSVICEHRRLLQRPDGSTPANGAWPLLSSTLVKDW